jgi:NADH-quinone oxidoreductase subunit H
MNPVSDWLIGALKLRRFIPDEVVYLAMILVAGVVLLAMVTLVAGFLTYLERKVAGHMQSRFGPNRVGPRGLLQFVADVVKLLLKEDIIPTDADRPMFKLAPYLCFAGTFAVFAAIPFGPNLVASNLNVGIFYMMAVSSLVVIGIIMGGWASNNKWSLYGGMRSAAQIISYEIPVGLSLMCVVMITGSLGTQEIVMAQGGGGGILNWFAFHNPFTFIAFFIYFIAAIAENNRIPFDLPEAESELVSGYNTEYSGIRFAMFFLAEFANIAVLSAIASFVFLGGWQVPGFVARVPVLADISGATVFLVKVSLLSFVVLWLRWTLPRLRVDQLMSVSWKYLTPISFFCIFGTGLWILAFGDRGIFKLMGL